MSWTPARLQSPWAYAAVGASVLALPASAAAVDAATDQGGAQSIIKLRVKRRRIEYGQRVVVAGNAPRSAAGQTVELDYSSSTAGGWQQVASARVGQDGSFRAAGWLRRSGWLMASITGQASAAQLASGPSGSSTIASAPQRVAVAAVIRVRRRAINEFRPRAIELRGDVLPRDPWSRVLLQARRSGRWVTVSRARTNSDGAFRLRYRPSSLGRTTLRVRFAGDGVNAPASRPAGSVTVYHQTVASWYEDGGSTACGFHARYGVANLSLPCGTKVSFLYGGRVVQAVVDDRGPYVGGRTWDLNQNLAAALGVAGVVTVWSSR